jgi:riboflavin synthase
MFTGIISDIGTVQSAERRGDLRLIIASHYDMMGVAIGASIACSGVCLTVVEKGNNPDNSGWFAVDISSESISRSAPDMWEKGAKLNLERALKVGDELGGHIVTGHVDGVGEVTQFTQTGDSWTAKIAAPASLAPYIAAKGSITVDGVSLTVNAVDDTNDGRAVFTLNIIPHTAQVTTLGGLTPGCAVNLEIDVLARYLKRMEDVRTLLATKE